MEHLAQTIRLLFLEQNFDGAIIESLYANFTKREIYNTLILLLKDIDKIELNYPLSLDFIDKIKKRYSDNLPQANEEKVASATREYLDKYRVRFFALFMMIDKFSFFLAEPNEELADFMIHLLLDKHSPIVDRAAWALSIMGEQTLDKLIKDTQSDNYKLKVTSIYTLRKHKDIALKREEVIEIFLNAAQSTDPMLQFAGLNALMDISPWRGDDKLPNYDFTEIYIQIKPFVLAVLNSSDESHKEFVERWLEWIEAQE